MTWLSIIPILFQILGFFLKWYGASEELIRKYTEMIEQAQRDSLISVESKDKLMSQRDAILARLRAKNDQGNKP